MCTEGVIGLWQGLAAGSVALTGLGSAAIAGEGTQNYLCAAQAAAVLIGLAVTAAWPATWWLDPAIGLGIAAVALREGTGSWRGDDCC
jgi:divalent metal cation (Fe/Co/Zn/Cd) transporter